MGMYVFVELFFFKCYFNIKLEILLYCMNIKVIINIYKMLFFFKEVYCCNSIIRIFVRWSIFLVICCYIIIKKNIVKLWLIDDDVCSVL